MNTLRVELKICEGCGVLWLRATTMDAIYCLGCAARLAEFPAPSPSRRRNQRQQPAQPARKRSTRCRRPLLPKLQPEPQTQPETLPAPAAPPPAPMHRRRCFGGVR
jgi:hypothetical protein